MKAMVLLACGAVALAGCRAAMNPGADVVPPKPLAGTKWVMQLELPLPAEQPHVQFGDGFMEGFSGCNKIAGRYQQDSVGARFISFGRIETGFKVCDARAQAAERRLLEVMQTSSSYSITADEMTMTGSAGTIKFRSDPPYEVKK